MLAGCSSNGSTSNDNPVVTPSATTTTAPPTGTSSPTPNYDAVVNLTVANGKVTGDTPRAKVKKGQRVAIIVKSDVADEIHLHGYDKMVDVTAGGTATLVFVADIPGVFTVELESRSKELTKIQVS
ncbi:MAG: hypothetical protein QOG53_1847 [Frankiales bacterium]|nr:hypothetical protein [Frankiales bacterium]